VNQQRLQTAGIALLILTVILLFIGWQQYQANVASVEAMNQMMQGSPFGGSSPFGGMAPMGGTSPFGGHLTPGTPASTTYSVFFAILTGIGGAVCMFKAKTAVA
jgi:hypothetical protein